MIMICWKKIFNGRKILLVAPGKSIVDEEEKVKDYIRQEKPVVIGVNAINTHYEYDYLFFVNRIRYDYAAEAYADEFRKTKKILLSNIHIKPESGESIINFNNAIKRGWEHFDNAVICALRLMGRLEVKEVVLAGFDGFKTKYNESYADASLPTLNPDNKWDELNEEIIDMFRDVKMSMVDKMTIKFITDSIFNV